MNPFSPQPCAFSFSPQRPAERCRLGQTSRVTLAWRTAIAVGIVGMVPRAVSAQSASVALRGIVRDSATNSVVAGAIVDVRSATYQSAVRSDESGAFFIGRVPEGLYRLTVLRLGYLKIDRDLQVTKADSQLMIVVVSVAQRLSPVRVGTEGAGIYGVVGDAKDLHPLSGIKIFVAGANESILTDSTGAFFAPIKKPGMYVVRMSGNGFAEEIAMVDVPEKHVVDASRLLDESNVPPRPPGPWDDFDQRLRWRSSQHSALVTGSEIREVGGDLGVALNASKSVVLKGLKISANACVIVDGAPHPGWHVADFRPEEIEAVELYGAGDKTVGSLLTNFVWPRPNKCTPKTSADVVQWVVIWTKR
jgi:hypothetical protein